MKRSRPSSGRGTPEAPAPPGPKHAASESPAPLSLSPEDAELYSAVEALAQRVLAEAAQARLYRDDEVFELDRRLAELESTISSQSAELSRLRAEASRPAVAAMPAPPPAPPPAPAPPRTLSKQSDVSVAHLKASDVGPADSHFPQRSASVMRLVESLTQLHIDYSGKKVYNCRFTDKGEQSPGFSLTLRKGEILYSPNARGRKRFSAPLNADTTFDRDEACTFFLYLLQEYNKEE